MTKLIASVVVLIALAILITMNANYRSSVNLYGARFENVSVVVIAIAGFVLGVAYSLLLYVLNFLRRRAKQGRARAAESLKKKEAELAQREQSVAQAGQAAGQPGSAGSPSQSGESAPGEGAANAGGVLRRLARRRRTTSGS